MPIVLPLGNRREAPGRQTSSSRGQKVSQRELLLLRHAESLRDEVPEGGDHERRLPPGRGIRAAERMGRLIVEKNLVPDLILCSTAARARETLDLASRAAEHPTPDLSSTALPGRAERLLSIVRRHAATSNG